ncbi:uncharacterized protein LOC127243220 [Andrographis paniculata]|uniref:uncharacterized protein LOC127243220 n=1 Tax=Andrographis paniculata TaxID=175694 RepID=UPI0021E9641E|nr:uncharacterized protein LOC127243220 [Andrographis paniculata]
MVRASKHTRILMQKRRVINQSIHYYHTITITMYVTKPRSLYRRFPAALSAHPPADGPFSGQLVVTDEDSDAMDSSCCGICNTDRIKNLPLPSDRILKVVHSLPDEAANIAKVWFVPVLDHPLSSNRYYAIKARGHHKGRAYTCSKEGDAGMCCCPRTSRMSENRTRPFDHRDRYQQMEIRPYPGGGFFARSVEWDGYPPSFLRKGGWEAYVSHSFKVHLREAPALREPPPTALPGLDFPVNSRRSIPAVIGKWYCPFMFVKEDDVRCCDQMRKSLLYEVSLKLWWERIYSADNDGGGGGCHVEVDARVNKLICLVNGKEGEKDERQDMDGFVLFKLKGEFGKRGGVGLSLGLYEKMKWLQETRGWFDGERYVRVSGRKEIHGHGGGCNDWTKFGCYVLVESFVVRAFDGRLVINFNFKNTDKIACKWE